jgi:hypothetical protein
MRWKCERMYGQVKVCSHGLSASPKLLLVNITRQTNGPPMLCPLAVKLQSKMTESLRDELVNYVWY